MRRLARIVVALAAFGTVTAIAAPDQTVPVASPAPAVVPSAEKKMSLGEMNVAAANIVAQLEDDGQQVTHLQEVAKKQKDVIKLNCVNDRLIQIKAQRNIADESHAQLSSAMAKNSDERFSLYQSLQITAQAVKELREQAKSCIGEPELFKQESGVTVEHPPTPDDPTLVNPTIEVVEPPAYSSPFT